MTDVLLVLGMHRSGTSAVAGTLARLGGGLPKHLMPAHESNARGFFESVALMGFHDELLASAGTDWSDWRSFNPGWLDSPVAANFRQRAKDLFADEFDGSSLPVLKDPRICRFTPFWLDVLRDLAAVPHVAMPIRSPLDVAQSLGQAHGFPLSHGLLLWLRHVLDAEAQTRSLARSIFTWSEFLLDWRGVCGRIASDTHLSWPRLSDRSSREIDKFLSRDLVHHETDQAALVAHGDVHEWTLRAYDSLRELAADPSAESALATLDEVRLLLDQSSRIFGRLLIDNEIDLQELRGREQAASSERDALRARQAEILSEREAAETARRETDSEKDGLSQRLAAAVAERDELGAAHAGAMTDLQSRQQELAEKATALAELAARAEAAEDACHESERAKDGLSQSLAAAVAERDGLGVAHAAVVEELQSRERDLVARAAAAEKTRRDTERERDGLSQRLAASVAERHELAAAHAGAVAGLQREVAELAARAVAAETARDEMRAENGRLARSLASSLAERDARREEVADKEASLAEIGSRLQMAEIAHEEAVQENAALAEAREHDQAQLDALRGQLMDVEAALSAARAAGMRKGFRARLTVNASQRVHIAKRLLRSGLFDPEFYRTQFPASIAAALPDGRKGGLAMAKHYVEEGFCGGFFPNPLFDTRWYLQQYGDVRHAGINPLFHYVICGARERRDPGPAFQTEYYLEANPDVRALGLNPLAHYLRFGHQEGRLAMRPE